MTRTILVCWLFVTSSLLAAESIPDVRTLDELRAAPLWMLADGSRVRVGLSDGGPLAGPWNVLYCLLERDGGASTRPAASTRSWRGILHTLGPLRYVLEWDQKTPDMQSLVMARQLDQTPMPVLYAGGVTLDRPGTLRLRLYAPDDRFLAEREIRVEQVRPMLWTQFARRLQRRQLQPASQPISPDGVVEDHPFPAMPHFSRAGISAPPATRTTTRPAQPLPGDIAEVPDDAASLLRLSLDDQTFVLRVADGRKMLTGDADEDALARWWDNGRPIEIPRDAIPRQVQHQQQAQRMLRRSSEARVVFGLPDFLGPLKPGDRVGLQVLWCPDGTDITPGGPMMMQKLMSMMQRDQWAWPVLSNRIEFVMTDPLLAQRDHPQAQSR